MKICPRCMRQFDDDHTESCPDDGTRLREFRDSSSQITGVALDGRWLIEEKIGEGGMGEVYRARQVNVDRVVAVKILRLALASTEQYVARFFREADIATTVQHPHFVTIYDFGQTENQLLYIAMELLDGEPLSTIMKRRRLDLLEALTIASQVCAALAAAHTARIVHRDLKPDNIFLINIAESETFVKVLDFGIAKDLDSTDQVTRTGQLFGTPEYMSPEQCEGSNRVDGRSDLYALGCLLYEILTGRSPFQRDSIIQTLLAQVSDEAKSFSELGIPVPTGVEAIVMKLLQKHPDNRFSSAIETREALGREIDRLRKNSGEIHVYETVSSGIQPRDRSAQTVSYSDLGHPLQLEGILASSAKAALISGAERRREAESEKSTENVEVLSEGGNSRAALLAIVACLAILGCYFAFRGPAPTVIAQPVAVELGPVMQAVEDAATRSQRQADETATESEARRSAAAVALTAATFLATPAKIDRPKEPTESGLRTQSSMSRRLLKREPKLLECYQRREDTFDAGAVVFDFSIDAEGNVLEVNVTSKAMKSATVLGCMKDAVAKLKFLPALTGGTYHKVLTFRAQ